MRFHTQTAGVSLTAQQPLVNIVRTTIEALAGVLGGTQSLHTNSYDEALALPTEEAVRLALRTQQVIAHETGVTNTIDPLGGAYFVEKLTDEMEAAAREYFARIDELGGMVEAVKRGYPAARDRRRRVPLPARGRPAQADRRRRQRVQGGRRRADPHAQDRPRDGAQAGGAPRGDQGRPRLRRGRGSAGRAQGGRRERRREPDAALPRPRRGPAPRRARWSPPSRRSSGPSPSSRSSSPFSGRRPRVSRRRMADLKVVPSEVDGWDVVNAEDGVAVTEPPRPARPPRRPRTCGPRRTRSARTREGEVIVDPEHSHGIDDDQRASRPRSSRSAACWSSCAAGHRHRADRRAHRLRLLAERSTLPAQMSEEAGEEDPRRRGQARPRRARPWRQDHRSRPPRRRHGGHLHGPSPDARADRRDGDPGGRRRGRPLDPLRRAHDARAARGRAAEGAGRRGRRAHGGGDDPQRRHPASSRSSASTRSSRPGSPTDDIVEFIRGAVGQGASA